VLNINKVSRMYIAFIFFLIYKSVNCSWWYEMRSLELDKYNFEDIIGKKQHVIVNFCLLDTHHC